MVNIWRMRHGQVFMQIKLVRKKMKIKCEDIYSVFLLVIKVQNNYALIIVWLWPDFTLRKLRIWKERECEEKGNESFSPFISYLSFHLIFSNNSSPPQTFKMFKWFNPDKFAQKVLKKSA